ncbi:hypothetical protein ACFLY6_00155 [Candidatus Dependentiae bacterium]
MKTFAKNNKKLAITFIIVSTTLFADIPASYERLFREQESHIKGLEEQLSLVSTELEKEKANSAQLRELTEKHQGLLHSFDKLKLIKTKIQKELAQTKERLSDLKKYYSLELKEADIREKRMLRASTKVTDTLHEREKRISELEGRILALTTDIKQSHARYVELASGLEAKQKIESKKQAAFKREFENMRIDFEKTHRQASIKEQELEKTLRENKTLNTLLSATREEANKAFTSRMKSLKNKYEHAEKEIVKHKETRKKIEKKMANMRKELNMTNTILHTTSKTKNALFNEKIELKKLLVETAKDLEYKIERLEKDLDNYKFASAEKDKLIAEMKETHEKFDKVLAEKNHAQERAYNYKRDLEQTTTLLSSLTQEIKNLKTEKKTLKEHAESIINKNKELAHKNIQFKGVSNDLDTALSELETTKSLLRQKDEQLQAYMNMEVKTKRSINDLKIEFADTVALLDTSKGFGSRRDVSEKISKKLIDLSGALARETEINAMLRKELALIKEEVESKLLSLTASLDKVERERNVLSITETAFRDKIGALDSMVRGVLINREGDLGEKIAELALNLKRSQTATESLRQKLARKRRGAAAVSQRHKLELTSMAKDLKIFRKQLGQSQEKLVAQANEHRKENEAIVKKQAHITCDLENALSGIRDRDKKIEKLTAANETIKTKTQQLLASLGFDGEKGKEALKANYLRMIAEKELSSIPFSDLQSGKARLSSGLVSILKDGRVLGQMIEDYGMAAYIDNASSKDKCGTLYKLFLAKKRLTPEPDKNLSPLFKRYTSIAQKHLKTKKIGKIALHDLEARENPLSQAIF